jgi:hypothetical protein
MGEVRIFNRAAVRWRENVERKKVKRKKEKERERGSLRTESRGVT